MSEISITLLDNWQKPVSLLRKCIAIFSTIAMVSSTLVALTSFVCPASSGEDDYDMGNVVGMWHLDEESGTTIYDHSNNSNDGEMKNGPHWVAGIHGTAIEFDGVDDYIEVPHNESLNVGNKSFTIEFWMKRDDIPESSDAENEDWIVSKVVSAHPHVGFQISMLCQPAENGLLRFQIYSTPDDYEYVYTTVPYDDGLYHHVACVKDGTNSISIFVDGELDNSKTMTTATGSLDNTEDLVIGATNLYARHYDGVLDEVVIHNKALEPEDFYGLRFSPSSIVGMWSLDENTGTTISDSSKNSNNGTIDGPSWSPGIHDSGLSFDGSNDIVTIDHDDSLNFGNGSFSIEFWMKHDDIPESNDANDMDFILEKRQDSGDIGYLIGLHCYPSINGQIEFWIGDDESSDSENIYSDVAVDDNEWHHILCVKNEDKELSIYVDGELTNTKNIEKVHGNTSNDESLVLGADSAPARYLDGILDEIVFHNSAITPEESYGLQYGTRNPSISFGEGYLIGYAGSNGIISVESGDLDNDGDIDAISGDWGSNIYIWENDGTPWGSWDGVKLGTAGGAINCIAIGDIDNDGDFDIATADLGSHVYIWENDGTPWESWSGNDIGIATQICSVEVGDLDNDGDLDLVTSDHDGRSVHAWKNDGSPFNGTWVKTIVGTMSHVVENVAIGDLDNDGWLDIASTDEDSNVYVWENDGTPFNDEWSGTHIGNTGGIAAYGVALGDLDNDGWLDIITTDEGSNVYIWENDETPWGTWISTDIGDTGGRTFGLAIGEFNNDGWIDIVSGDNSGKIFVWENDHTPWGSWNEIIIENAGDNIFSLSISDLDNDGDQDIISSDKDTGFFAWKNTRSPFSFDMESGIDIGNTGEDVICIQVGDLDNDGDHDIVTGDAGNNVFIWENDGSPWGAWERTDIADASDEIRCLTIGDLDNDGDLDLIAGDFSHNVFIWENDGTPFDDSWNGLDIGDGGSSIYCINVGDLDNDGDLDIISGDVSGSGGKKLYVWENDGTPFDDSWSKSNAGNAGDYPLTIEVADFDNDGDLDLVVGYHDAHNIYVYENDRTPFNGTWNHNSVGVAGGEVRDIAIGDLDNDGDIDIITGDNGNRIYVWENDKTPFTNTWSGVCVGTTEGDNNGIELVDLDIDGWPDIVTGDDDHEEGDPKTGSVMIWENDGSPWDIWSGKKISPLIDRINDLSFCDLDNDGDIDIISGDKESNVNIWENLANKHIDSDIYLTLFVLATVASPGDSITAFCSYSEKFTYIDFVVEYPNGTTMISDTIISDNVGKATFSFSLSDDVPLGTYMITANTTDASSTISITIIAPPIAIIDSISPNPALLGETITFQGSAMYNGTIYRYVWTSSLDGEFSNSTQSEFAIQYLGLGAHTITLKVLGENDRWSDTALSSVNITKRPIAIIQDNFPSPNPALDSDTIDFRAWGVDDEGISLCEWSSNITGILHEGIDGNFSLPTLTMGYHQLTFRVQNDHGIWSENTTIYLNVTTTPVGIIQYIFPNPALEGTSVEFQGRGDDDGSIVRYRWESSIDGSLYNGTWSYLSLSTLSVGSHQISFWVQDNHGFWSEEAIFSLDITSKPIAIIDSITPNPAMENDEITLVGYGIDDGTIERYEWSSSIDGVFFNGTIASATISALTTGAHQISLKVMDNHGIWSEPHIEFLNILSASPDFFITPDSLDMPLSRMHLPTPYSIEFENHGPMPGNVDIEIRVFNSSNVTIHKKTLRLTIAPGEVIPLSGEFTPELEDNHYFEVSMFNGNPLEYNLMNNYLLHEFPVLLPHEFGILDVQEGAAYRLLGEERTEIFDGAIIRSEDIIRVEGTAAIDCSFRELVTEGGMYSGSLHLILIDATVAFHVMGEMAHIIIFEGTVYLENDDETLGTRADEKSVPIVSTQTQEFDFVNESYRAVLSLSGNMDAFLMKIIANTEGATISTYSGKVTVKTENQIKTLLQYQSVSNIIKDSEISAVPLEKRIVRYSGQATLNLYLDMVHFNSANDGIHIANLSDSEFFDFISEEQPYAVVTGDNSASYRIEYYTISNELNRAYLLNREFGTGAMDTIRYEENGLILKSTKEGGEFDLSIAEETRSGTYYEFSLYDVQMKDTEQQIEIRDWSNFTNENHQDIVFSRDILSISLNSGMTGLDIENAFSRLGDDTNPRYQDLLDMITAQLIPILVIVGVVIVVVGGRKSLHKKRMNSALAAKKQPMISDVRERKQPILLKETPKRKTTVRKVTKSAPVVSEPSKTQPQTLPKTEVEKKEFWTCPACSHNEDLKMNHCLGCGYHRDIKTTWVCPNCCTPVSNDLKLCLDCGYLRM